MKLSFTHLPLLALLPALAFLAPAGAGADSQANSQAKSQAKSQEDSRDGARADEGLLTLSLIHISEPTRPY